MIYKVQKNEIKRASSVLADSFKDDPLWDKLFNNIGDKKIHYPIVAELFLQYLDEYGEIHASSNNFEGVMALTYDEYSFMSLWRMIRSGAILKLFRLGLKGIMNTLKMDRVFTPLENARRKIMKDRQYIYLQMLGVSSDNQGQGHGTQLLKYLIKRSEEENLPIYLETETEVNVEYYKKFGFEVVGEMTLPIIHQPMWAMKREI